MAGIMLNGTTFYPSDVPKELSKIGVSLPMASGTRRFVQRTVSGTPVFKRTWALPWLIVPEATRAAVQTIALLTTTFTFVDHLGVSYTVQTEEDSYTEKVSVIVSNTVFYYDLTLKLYQA